MSRLRRHPRPPADVTNQVTGKVLAAGELSDGGWVLMTLTAIAVVGGQVDLHREWHAVDRGEWSSDEPRLRLTWVDQHEPTELSLRHDDRTLAAVMRERIESSLVHVEFDKLPGGALLRAAIRRGPDGGLFSQVSLTGSAQPDAGLEERIRTLEGRVRAQVGLPA